MLTLSKIYSLLFYLLREPVDFVFMQLFNFPLRDQDKLGAKNTRINIPHTNYRYTENL